MSTSRSTQREDGLPPRSMHQPLDRSAHDYLLTLKRRGVTLGLERMRQFAAALGNPQEAVPVIHVAGTNGKGSVAAMLEAILRAAGWRVGLYTSPHLVRLGERVQVNRQALSASQLSAYVGELRMMADWLAAQHGDAQPSYFEFMTGLALTHFVRARCDIAVVEVGVGGRLDATNIVTPEVAVITSIGLDHCDLLGDTLEAIAREKAGIIKRGRPVVIGRLPAVAEEVVRSIAVEQGASVHALREVFGESVDAYPNTNLSGEYQRVNAATAALTARRLAPQWRITDDAIAHGLGSVDWPARWQSRMVGGRRVIIDTSHNAEGAEALAGNLTRLAAETNRRPIVVIGVLGAARAKPLLEVVCRGAAAIHLVVPQQGRACTHDQLEELLPSTCDVPVKRSSVADVFPGGDVCLPEVARDVVVVVTGSIYLAGEVLARIDPSCGPFEPDLQDF
jgi:dihydrofolate synthase / folylpolyglutamate synthase